MNFIISDIVTYNKLYAQESHLYLQLKYLKDLDGFPRIGIRIHEFDVLDWEQEVLLKQVEALAFFGYVNLIYVDDEGNENVQYPRATSLLSNVTKKEIARPFKEGRATEQQIQAFLDNEEDGCSSGACAI